MVLPLAAQLSQVSSKEAPRSITAFMRAAVARCHDNGTGEDMLGLRDAGQCTLAEMGHRGRSSLAFGDNDFGARSMWCKPEVATLFAAGQRGRKNASHKHAGIKVAKTEGTLLVLALLVAFGFVDRAMAQQQPSQANLPNQIGQSQVQIVPQTPGYRAPKPYQVTPQTSQPTPMYPQTQSRPPTGR
jgi:hypothetical protein